MASRLTTLIVVLIVAGTFIAGLIVGAQRDDLSGPVDLIITNGKVYTGSPDDFAEALAVRGNKILRVGSNREIKRMRRPQTVVLDAHGATVLPGFNDAHVHLLEGALALLRVNLEGSESQDAVAARLREYAAAHPDRTWLVAGGWSPEGGSSRLTARQQLDAMVADRPVVITAEDGRTSWVNSRALAEAHITRRTPNPTGGTIERDARGEPTGVLKGSAVRLIASVIPPPSPDDQRMALRAVVSEAQRFGVTSMQDAGSTPGELALIDELRRSGDLQVRVYAALPMGPGMSPADRAAADELRRKYADDPVFKAGAAIIHDSGAAAHDDEPAAAASSEPADTDAPAVARLIDELDDAGWQVLVRAVGEQGVKQALDAYEAAARDNAEPPRGRRHRIEQIEAIEPSDAPRFGALGVIAALEPLEAPAGPDSIKAVGADVATDADAVPSTAVVSDGSVKVALGSGWPARPLDPRLVIAAASAAGASDQDGAAPQQNAMSLKAAIDGYTSGAAYASFDDHRKGRLERDMLADIVILSSDIFAEHARVLDAVVETTIFDGRVVYTRTPPGGTE